MARVSQGLPDIQTTDGIEHAHLLFKFWARVVKRAPANI